MPGGAHETYGLIPHPHEPRVLFLPGDGGWTLPRFATREEREINHAMRERYGVEATVLREVYSPASLDSAAAGRVVALEIHTQGWAPPPDAVWLDAAALRGATIAVPAYRPLLDAWLAEAESGAVPPLRAPWARPGWFAHAAAWMREQAARAGHPLVGAVEQHHVRSWATVLRAPTAASGVYFKAVIPAFGFEPALTEALAARWPAHIPPVLAIDAARGWLLTADAGTRLREVVLADRDPAHWEGLLSQFARMQIEAAANAGTFVALGCPDRRPDVLPMAFAGLVADRASMRVGLPDGLAEDEWARARAFVPEVAALCAELARYRLPATIHHDDFGPGNMLVGRGGAYVFLDWSESAVAHPFFTLFMALRWGKLVLDYDQPTLDRLRDAYFAPWTSHASRADLRDAFALAQRLAKLTRSLTYQHYVRGLEADARREFADSAPYWLRMFLNDDDGD